jgi:hypothetical protein
MKLIKVYLQDEALLSNHAMVQLPLETIEDYGLLERGGRFYMYHSFQASCAFYRETKPPLHIED